MMNTKIGRMFIFLALSSYFTLNKHFLGRSFRLSPWIRTRDIFGHEMNTLPKIEMTFHINKIHFHILCYKIVQLPHLM